MLLQAFYGIRSERQLMERLENLTRYSAGLSVWAWTIRCGTTRQAGSAHGIQG
jgi:hypothetical protein